MSCPSSLPFTRIPVDVPALSTESPVMLFRALRAAVEKYGERVTMSPDPARLREALAHLEPLAQETRRNAEIIAEILAHDAHAGVLIHPVTGETFVPLVLESQDTEAHRLWSVAGRPADTPTGSAW